MKKGVIIYVGENYMLTLYGRNGEIFGSGVLIFFIFWLLIAKRISGIV